ncbi:MAG TPA: acetylxylan esterase [Gemmatales bacterium]|nr:acetylxylan esterase [Gemmatales bacterium]
MKRLSGLLLVIATNIVHADEVPAVECKAEPLLQNLRAMNHAFKEAGVKQPAGVEKALKEKDADEMQKLLDPFVAAVVTINPESRVKVMRGPYPIKHQLGWPTPALVKVINEGGVTARIKVHATGDKSTSVHFYEDAVPGVVTNPLSNKLSGQSVEYQVMLIRSLATNQREITLTFDVGQATQDLGFRAELPVLLAPDVPWDVNRFIPDKQDLLWRPDGIRRTVPIKVPIFWSMRASIIRNHVERVTGPMVIDTATNLDVRVESEEAVGRVIRRKITYLTSDGDRVPAYVLMPAKTTGKLPAVLCLHQTTKIGKGETAGLGGLANLHYALELAQRGYVTIAPDYPGFGDYANCNPYQLGYASATAKGIVNHRRAIDVLASMSKVDLERIGCIGHSLGGHNTLFVSLFDPRIKVLATSCGFCSFPKYFSGDLKGWSHKGYMPRIASLYQCDPKQMPFDFTEILAAMAPRPVFINAPIKDANFDVDGVRDCVKAALAVYQLFGKEEHLVAEHPDCEHDFPTETRQRCYAFFDKHLKAPSTDK